MFYQDDTFGPVCFTVLILCLLDIDIDSEVTLHSLFLMRSFDLQLRSIPTES